MGAESALRKYKKHGFRRSSFANLNFLQESSMKQQTTIQAAVAGLFALGLAASVSAAPVAPDASKDKCFGVAKAGQNDCAAGKHACAGQSAVDNDPVSWKYVAKGTCEKVGGKMAPPKA
jgi:uncharacterized membrane protein